MCIRDSNNLRAELPPFSPPIMSICHKGNHNQDYDANIIKDMGPVKDEALLAAGQPKEFARRQPNQSGKHIYSASGLQ